MYYYLSPEVAGGIGESSILDTTVFPPVVSQLEYTFDGWLGDDILEAFPCFIITYRLQVALEKANITGCQFDNVKVTKSDFFMQAYPGKSLPAFAWLKITGKATEADLGVTSDVRLVVSERALNLLQQFTIENCDVAQYLD